MEYIYSAMVLHAAGKDITEEGIKNILEAAGIEVNDTRIKALTSSLEGIDIEEAMASAVSAAPAAAAPALGGEEKKEEVKKEEPEEEEEAVSEEEAAAGLGALFG